MSKPLIFISYRHGPPWTKLAAALNVKLLATAEAIGFEVFLDSEAIRASAEWKALVDAALERCTHFVALLCDDYWVRSNECLRELYRAVERYEASGRASPRLLFVLAADMRPELLTFHGARQRGDLQSDDPQLKAIGDINFLGPFDADLRLQSLAWNNAKRLDKQLAQLRDRLLQSGGFAAH